MKNPQKGFIVPVIIIILTLIIGAGVYTYTNNKKIDNNKIDSDKTLTQSTSTNIVDNNTENILSKNCIENDKYYVISQEIENGIGSNILIKHKNNINKNIKCSYSKEETDFEIKKSEVGYYIIGLENDYLILDSGTAPYPRRLTIYDLSKNKEIYSDIYSIPTKISQNMISYWNPTKQKSTIKNCPQFEENTDNQLGSIIEEYVNLDLTSLNKISTNQYRCSVTQ